MAASAPHDPPFRAETRFARRVEFSAAYQAEEKRLRRASSFRFRLFVSIALVGSR